MSQPTTPGPPNSQAQNRGRVTYSQAQNRGRVTYRIKPKYVVVTREPN
jgi:hypothetical protein